ncbi:hypothetical protein ACUJ40_01845 [Halococcus saccharolyticus]|uniref:hypothetical protein n=1 Tax=Halococcus saccharolyticus TaxID=62319 RepID=UPI000AAA6B2E|nr:hypothetical protein [Halococcus saccharolyticus]
MIATAYRSLDRLFRRWFLAADPLKRVCAWLTVAVCVVAVVLGAPPTYSLDSLYTDHLHHAYAAWALLNIGPEVFTTPIDQWDFGALRPFVNWAALPYLYPFGSLLLFLPFGVVNNLGLLPASVVNLAMVITFGLGGVGATWLLARTLRESYRPVLVGGVLLVAAPLYVFWGLNGFFDSVAAAVALYGILAYRQGRDGVAMLALVSALSLHYRLWYLGPLAVVVTVRYVQARNWAVDWRLGLVGVLGGASVASFVLSIPGFTRLSETPQFNASPIAVTAGITPLVAATLVCGALVLMVVYRYESNPVTLATVTLAIVSMFVLTQWSPWYPILLTPVFGLVNHRRSHVTLVAGFYGVTLLLGFVAANHSLLRFL